jgi:hypothetical protein
MYLSCIVIPCSYVGVHRDVSMLNSFAELLFCGEWLYTVFL